MDRAAKPSRQTRPAKTNGNGGFEQIFKNIDDVLWKEAGCTTELDYTEQTSWMLFLRYLDDLEADRAAAAELRGVPYVRIIDKPHSWNAWAAPRKSDGSFDHDRALTGDDLIDYVNRDLFPYLQGFKTRAENADTIEYKIGEIFGEIKSKFQSGYSLRDALELIVKNTFLSNTDNAAVALRRELLTSCDLHTVLDMPGGTFQGAGVKTVVLFFEKGAPTRRVWFYKLDPGRNLGKTNALDDADMAEFVRSQAGFEVSDRSWSVDLDAIDKEMWDLSVKNPSGGDEGEGRSPEAILAEITALDAESARILERIRAML